MKNDDARRLLQDAGGALFGDQWKGPLAAALGISHRTMARWIADPDLIWPDVWGEIAGLLAEESDRLRAIEARARRRAATPETGSGPGQ